MLTQIVIGILALLFLSTVILLIVAMLRSSDFRVSRSITVSASPAKAFEQVNDLRLMNAWNPWIRLDPNLKQSYSVNDTGVGYSYSWDGNGQVGAGTQTIVESKPDELVRFKLEFRRPFAGTNDVEFRVAPIGNQTSVTWSMTGKLSFIPKVVGLFLNMEKMCGDQFEQGLANMKSIVESK